MIRNMVNENCRNRNNPWESSGFALLTRVTSIDQIHFRAKRGGNDTESMERHRRARFEGRDAGKHRSGQARHSHSLA